MPFQKGDAMSTLRLSALLALFTLAFLSSGAYARADDETATVEGTVVLNDKPLMEGARIFFHFADGQFIGAKIGKDGKFKMKAVPPGAYKVTVEMPKAPPAAKVEQVLPPQYSAQDKTDLQVEVKKGANTLDFKLLSR
jgi:hypothetical protein